MTSPFNAIAGTPITNTNYWRPLTLRGEQGASGTSLTFRYTWDATQTYYSQDIVVYNNVIWDLCSMMLKLFAK